MSQSPDLIAALLREREEARAAKDFERADVLRDEIERAGFVVKDTPTGSTTAVKKSYELLDPNAINDTLTDPATLEVSFHLLYEGFLDDLGRFLSGLGPHLGLRSVEVVVVDNASGHAEQVRDVASGFPFVRVLHLDREVGWASARNAGLKTSRGETIVLVDLSIEPVGDIISPLVEALSQPGVALAGPYGLASEDLREWRPASGPHVQAIEGYLLATRRGLLAQGLIDERFRWYRNADIDLSFQLRERGGRAVSVDLPIRKHVHRGWEALDEQERLSRSKRNHRIFYERWRRQGERPG